MRLQPYSVEAATLFSGGCNPIQWRLRPYSVEAATLISGGCDPILTNSKALFNAEGAAAWSDSRAVAS